MEKAATHYCKRILRHIREFYKAFEHVLTVLSKLIVKDGEGATKFIEVTVKGASIKKRGRSKRDGRYAIRYWLKPQSTAKMRTGGEFLPLSAGREYLFNPDRTEIFFGGLRILGKNYNISFSEEKGKKNPASKRNYDNRRSPWRQPLRNIMDM